MIRDGVVLGTSPLVTTTSVDLSRVEYMKDQLRETLRTPGVILAFWALVLLFAAYIFVVVRYRSKRRAYQKRLELARTIRLDMEDDEEELRHERRVRATTRRAAQPPPRGRDAHARLRRGRATRVTGERPAAARRTNRPPGAGREGNKGRPWPRRHAGLL